MESIKKWGLIYMNQDSFLAAETGATRLLRSEASRIRIFPGRDHRATLAELAVLHTRPMQRLARLRQVGLGYMVWPTAEHTRLAHSIGTTYWAVKFLEHLRDNAFTNANGRSGPGNQQRLENMDVLLGPEISLDLVVRLFALTHDIILLPLGHTLQYQLGYYRHTGADARRAQICLNRVREQVRDSPDLGTIADPKVRAAVTDCLIRHLDVVECVFGTKELLAGRSWDCSASWIDVATLARWLPVLCFVQDLVVSTFSADIVDFSMRDSLGAGIPRSFDEPIAEYLCIFDEEPEGLVAEILASSGKADQSSRMPMPLQRLGLNALDGKLLHDVITGVISLIRIRYELAEKIFLHDTKCKADAMLDRAIRTIDERDECVAKAVNAFEEARLLRMGDDELLDLLEIEERETLASAGDSWAGQRGGSRLTWPVMGDLLSRRFFDEVFRLSDAEVLTDFGRAVVECALDPAVRNRIERQILERVPGLTPTDVIFSSRPLAMQMKDAEMLVAVEEGSVRPLREVAERGGYGGEALEISQRYRHLWSLSVYLRPAAGDLAGRLRAVCEELLGRQPTPGIRLVQ